MKYHDFVSQQAVNLFLSHCGACASVNDSVSIRTDTTLDQDCVLKVKCACMYSVHDRVIVDNMSEFEHSSFRASCTFSMQDSRVKRGSTTGHKTQQARLPADSGLYNSTFPSLVNCILTIQECQSDHHGSCTSTAWSRRSVCSLYHPRASVGSTICSPIPVSSQNFPIACCFCFALALLIALALLMMP